MSSECQVFFLDDFSAFSFKVYKIVSIRVSAELAYRSYKGKNYAVQLKNGGEFVLGEDGSSIFLEICTEKDACISDQIILNYKHYVSSNHPTVASGCYSFQPTTNTALPYGAIQDVLITEGEHMIQTKVILTNLYYSYYPSIDHQRHSGN